MAIDEDELNHCFEEHDDERCKFISASESNLAAAYHHHHHHLHTSTMSKTKTPSSETETEPKIIMEGQGHRRKSSQSLAGVVGSAHTQLQIFAQDVKEELKELAQPASRKRSIVEVESSENNNNNDDSGQSDKPEKKVRTGWQRYLGIILAITSSSIFALCILIVKSLPEYHPYSVSFWRFQGVLLPTIPILFWVRVVKKQKVFDSVWPPCDRKRIKTCCILILRGLTGTSAVVLQFYSLQFMNMADSSVISFSTPVFVSLASHLILGEKSGFIPILCGLITLFGVAVITRPPMLTGGEEFDTETLIGAGLALGCMFAAAATFLILRYLRQIHFAVITVFFGCWGSLQTLALSATIQKFQAPEGMDHWMMAVALALLTFIGQTCITLAFKFEQAGTVSLCRTFDILFAYVWQYVFLGIVPDVYSIIGGAIVIFGVLIAAFRKLVNDLPPEHPTRQRLWILLK